MSSNGSVIALNVPLSTALFTVDTRDGLKISPDGLVASSQNPYDINIYKNQQLFSGAVQRIALTEINLPWNVPNVNTYNNVLYLDNGVTTWALGETEHSDELGAVVPASQIQPGFYTPDELATAVETALNVGNGVFGTSGAPLTWTVEYKTGGASDVIFNSKFFQISNSPRSGPGGGVAFRINPRYGISKGQGSNGLFPNDTNIRSDTLATMMGFGYSGTSLATAQQGTYASMMYTNFVDIVSSVLCKNQDVRDTSTSYFNGSNILARIYIAGDKVVSIDNIVGTRPFHLHYEFPIPKEIQWNPEEFLPSCNIRIQDMFGNILYNPSPTPFTFGEIIGRAGSSNFVQMNMLISEAGSPSGKYTQF